MGKWCIGKAMENEVGVKSMSALTLCLEGREEERGGEEVRELKEDFRRLEVRFKCTARSGEESRCVRFKERMDGCTFYFDGVCGAGNS